MRVSETFSSRQGEGLLTGTNSFFIRTTGCNLRCWFCDTPYASWTPKGKPSSLTDLVLQAQASGAQHVVLTGGEPMLSREITALTKLLRQAGFHITIETAGTINREVTCDLMSISPKFSSSAPDQQRHPTWHRRHQANRLPLATIQTLIDQSADYQLKFVVDSSLDFSELIELLDQIKANQKKVWVMPQGSSIEAMNRATYWLKPWCESHGFNYCDRMQIRWYGNRRGT
ncbi:7-carboxy-7-deazaguanine synthase QueE [bacterium]|nr:7-carboxy-7-deazaguanine synthase QueE [bacterium]